MEKYSIFKNEITDIIKGNYQEEIYDWDSIKEVIKCTIENNPHDFGRNVVDFIDLGNWDFISAYVFDDNRRRLEITWHEGDKFHIYIEAIVVIEANGIIYIFLKGFFNDEAELNRIYNTKCTSCNITKFGTYMLDIYREVKRVNEVIQTPNINCYTTCILTRPLSGGVTPAGYSRDLMDSINISLAEMKIQSLYEDVKIIDNHDRDSLQEKGNTARRYLEYILMLVNVRIMHATSVNYQEQMLGDLVNIINAIDYIPLFKGDVTAAQKILNACSHHGGVRIDKEMINLALDVISNIIAVVKKTDINKLHIDNIFKSVNSQGN